MKVVIVGGVAGGATTAARLRRINEDAEIVVFERSGFVSYANCGLPYYIGGVITDEEELTLQSPESFKERFNVDVFVAHEVTKINADKKTVSVKCLVTGREFEESYDKLVLSPGARPAQPKMLATDCAKVFTLRTVEDTKKIENYVKANGPKTAVVAGGGFIGIEMAENLVDMGVKVTIVQMMPQMLPVIDEDLACEVHTALIEGGIDLRLNTTALGFEEDGDQVKTLIKDSDPISADMVIMAIGVTPDTYLAKDAGLELGLGGSIVVNERMETSAPDIYAVGDAVQIKNFVTGADALIPLAGPANKQARIVADNICGIDSVYRGSLGSSVVKVFGITAAVTGLNEKAAKAAGIDYDRVVLSPNSHASYYPGGEPMTMKVLFDKKTLKIIGGQIVGPSGVDKRIDVLATAIMAGMKASDIKELDLAYAPPYSSAKDPVNMAGFMIENIGAGRVKQFHWNELKDLPKDGSVVLLDVRTEEERDEDGFAPGFDLNIPVDELRERISEIPTGKPVYVMCYSGVRSYIACSILKQKGFDCYNFSGGYRFYDIVKDLI